MAVREGYKKVALSLVQVCESGCDYHVHCTSGSITIKQWQGVWKHPQILGTQRLAQITEPAAKYMQNTIPNGHQLCFHKYNLPVLCSHFQGERVSDIRITCDLLPSHPRSLIPLLISFCTIVWRAFEIYRVPIDSHCKNALPRVAVLVIVYREAFQNMRHFVAEESDVRRAIWFCRAMIHLNMQQSFNIR